ncbi:hypothetical protein B0T17DRAFT_519532 [Bombardia bombarda]|uniref:Integral membrane protein n=1 Tax=Bombardia bombarda TaxID=252184 RepID=A0AA40CGF7_9PEZI|nr:hypothetical protein B0T17DRAFT_519532 [Bombardia bombarda]
MPSVTRINVLFWLLWLLLLVFCYFNSYDDPSSIFYDANRAYDQRFSRLRAAEADEYIQSLPATKPSPSPSPSPTPSTDKILCIGIPSINRTTVSFLPSTIATLTDTLTPAERASVYLVVLLADKPPATHSAFGQSWLENIADQVLIYSDPPPPSTTNNTAVYHKIPLNLHNGSPRGPGRVENMRLDHSALVEACRAHGSQYFALVEDDIVASRDWFPRFRTGLARVEQQAAATNRDWIYLRLFYSELFMGWNSEEWLTYSETIFLVYAVVLLAFLTARRRFLLARLKPAAPTSPSPSPYSSAASAYLAALVFGLWIPALIVLYFLAGRLSVNRLNPLARSPQGVREMPRYGCCAQGLVFPQRHLEGFQAMLRDPPYDWAGDQMLEDYADARGLSKWALDPSVFQHVGLKESSDGPRRADVWNFSFERQKFGPKKSEGQGVGGVIG